MVRITKTVQTKHLETLSPWFKEFRDDACSIALPQLPKHLSTFPTRWPFPRGDLYHWISLLNRFDVVLENFCKTYKLDVGPQTVEFACTILESRIGEPENADKIESLTELGFADDGDRHLVESILDFSRLLLQNCGNRSIYASSSHLNDLLNSTSLPLLESTLLLGSELAQRYQAAIKRTSVTSRQHHAALLANHYNIDLDRVLQLAKPFTKTTLTPTEDAQPATPATPGMKGKEKASFTSPATPIKTVSGVIHANDLVSLVKVGTEAANLKSTRNGIAKSSASQLESDWEEWGDVKVTYYPKPPTDAEATSTSRPTNTNTTSTTPATPTTPTPVRRSSNLGPHSQRATRVSSSEDSPVLLSRTPTVSTEEAQRSNFVLIEIPLTKLKSVSIHSILRDNVHGLPQELQYELLTKLRAADALTTSLETRRQLLSVRLLAITNLAYAQSEAAFHENLLKQDSDEPRRLQLVYQLAELVHPPADGDVAVPKSLQTVIFATFNALSQHQSRFPDICAALNTNVSHGVLLYVVRKAIAEMSEDDVGDQATEEDEWRDAVFSLLSTISLMHRAGGDLVTAGLIPVLVEVLELRTTVSARYYTKVLSFLDTITYNGREALQSIISGEILDAVSKLIVHEISTASDKVASGDGLRPEYRSTAIDFEIPYSQQQIIKWLFKFIHHMMTGTTGIGANFDRLLRNLIDSSQLLDSLRRIIANANTFGSTVWTNAVSILNDFINNEPTSFAVIAEAGLSRGLLEAITGKPILMSYDLKVKKRRTMTEQITAEETIDGPSHVHDDDDEDSDYDEDAYEQLPQRPSKAALEVPREGPLARGILPTSETINIIPQAFGALCLNNAGMRMFQASQALESFFEIFESPDHVKCMQNNSDLPSNLGSTFDELVRHHPPLKTAIMNSIVNMVARVSYLCKTKGAHSDKGAKLWITDVSGKTVVANEHLKQALSQPSKGKGKAVSDSSDVEMTDAGRENRQNPDEQTSAEESGGFDMTPYVTAVATFLNAMLNNASTRAEFSTKSGNEYLFDLAESPCLAYQFVDSSHSRSLQHVIAVLSDQKPHLALPSLIKRAQAAADILAPFVDHFERGGASAFFLPFLNRDAQRSTNVNLLAQGTSLIKAFVSLHSMVSAVYACLQNIPHATRGSIGYHALNLGDHFSLLLRTLGPLLGASLREEYEIDKIVPDQYKNDARFKDSFFGDSSADLALASEPPSPPTASAVDSSPAEQTNDELTTTLADSIPLTEEKKPKFPTKAERESPEFRNFQTIRFLLGRMSRTVGPFFQTLGKVLVTKRGLDEYQKWSNSCVADALVESILQQLNRHEDGSVENLESWIGIIHVLRDVLIDLSRHNERPITTVTYVVQVFKDHEGFKTLNRILQSFTAEIRSKSLPGDGSEVDKNSVQAARYEVAVAGTKDILSLYKELVNGKNVTEASQTLAMNSATRDRERSRSSNFSPGQLIVELRMAILPTIRQLWESDLVEKAPCEISEKLIEVIRTIANADQEAGALKRTDINTPQVKVTRKTFKLNNELNASLTAQGVAADVAIEALFRCNNNAQLSTEYCREVKAGGIPRSPVPDGEISPTPESSNSRPHTSTSTGTATPDEHAMSIDSLANVPALIDSLSHQMPPPSASGSGPAIPQNFDQILNRFVPNSSPSSARASPLIAPQQPPSAVEESRFKQITIDDLNEERSAIRDNLIDKCLDVINAHGEVTFEIADLISTVVGKSPDPTVQRKIVGETLVIALMSFATDDDIPKDDTQREAARKAGKQVAAYAHLLALMLRDKSFYAAAVGQLKENLETLLGFIKLSPSHSADESSPWVAQILLIVEMLLSEDSRPTKFIWTLPKDDDDKVEPGVPEEKDLAVSMNERIQLHEALLEILPRIGKDEALALGVLRILVILTRDRHFAQIMGEKKNTQRLFVMAKQLAGAGSARIQSPLMIILRHMIEDDETIKQIMRSDIKSFFESPRQQRHLDHNMFLRGLASTAIRNPELFVCVTKEMVKYQRWTYQHTEGPSRSINNLVLQEAYISRAAPPAKSPDDAVQPTVQATEDLSLLDVKPSTEEAVDSEMPDASKSVVSEQKLPVVENTNGVIHFLLCELLNYKDVEDKELIPPSADRAASSANGDVAMTGTEPSLEVKSPKTPPKQEFKAEEHPIYIYRCFILQCLAELLSSYNRTKIEFINFKRSAPPQAMTPSKPRSSVVNYLLFDLIPIGTLDSAESIALRKKSATSSWADSVLTALLSKTGEQLLDKHREPSDGDDEPDLQFVRRFVLENILKAYREASASVEPLDVKYARLLSLAELMSHVMNGKESIGVTDTTLANRNQHQLKRIMFEKGFIAALTTSIADVDLKFPSAKRAVKYILRPLKVLTNTAIYLSDASLISATPGQNDEDEIESATSVSDIEDEREETPDLFRNSTLGMFEPGREEDSSSESDDDDEEMYEGEYDEEMEYEEEMPEDDEDNISDEDEDIEGMGPIEGLSGDHGVDIEVVMDDDDEDEEEGSSGDDIDEHDSEDDDARVEIIDEAGDIQGLAADDDMDGWESDDGGDGDEEEEDYEGQAADEEEEGQLGLGAMGGMDDMDGGPLGHLVRALGAGGEDAEEMLERMEEQLEAEGLDADGGEERMGVDYELDDEEDDDEEDEMEEEEMFIDANYPGDPSLGPVFGWEGDVDPPMIISHRGHHQHRPRAFPSPFPLFPGGHRDPLGVPDFRYRSHRPGQAPPRSADDGTNPLLQRNGTRRSGRDNAQRLPAMGHGWVQAMGGSPGADLADLIGFAGGRPFGEGPGTAALLDELMRSLPPSGTIARNGAALQFHITGPGSDARDLHAMFSLNRSRLDNRREAAEPGSSAFVTPQGTAQRWIDEAKLLFGPNYHEKAAYLKEAILFALVPSAIDAEKALKAVEEENKKKVREETEKRLEEERLAREAKEAEEKIEREKKEAEEREAVERANAEALAARHNESETAQDENVDVPETANPDAMDGVETESAQAEGEGEVQETPAADRPRVTTIIRGNPFDITDLGIDASFLAELPEEIREEVIMSAVAERRSQAAATGAQPSEIDQEFLDALPEDIRDEIIQQERQDRRRREREAARAAGPPAQDMDAASIIATLPPGLREQVLMDSSEDVLNLLPANIAEQARAAQREHGIQQGRVSGGAARRFPPVAAGHEVATQRPPRRAIVQMLDKSGIATLLRLMFVVQAGSLRSTFNSVLENISMNRHNRTEVLNTLLLILQDGSLDVSSVERSFAHLSLRAKQPKDKDPKTPQPLKRTLTGTSLGSQPKIDLPPIIVVQQCLAALGFLTGINPHVPVFFLTEHESTIGLKRTLSRKGKGKESKASKYPLNALLSLLDRTVIMDNSTVMESLSTLLNLVTQPLQALQRKQKEVEEAVKNGEAAKDPDVSVPATTGEASAPEATTSVDDPFTQLPSDLNQTAPIEPTAIPATTEVGGATASESNKTDDTSKASERKQRSTTFPIVPEQNLKLVINIFVVRDCSSRTFRESLSTVKNLSTIPGAKAVFGRELISKAQALGEIILGDLEELLPQIQKATSGTEIQGVALAKFSPGSSDQNKLLRVLTALDHLFDPKREKKDKPNELTTEGESSQLIEKQDLLSTLYDNSTFGPMWEKLSACLSAIRQREHLLNVATILLPLIEALMVVCKNTTLKDALIAQSQLGKEMMLTSPPPESRMETLFFTFTEEHRKILNELVRHSPKLMSGTFSLLVKNPKVLEFDNKRNYFSRSVHAKGSTTARQSFPPLQLSVRRDQVFHDSFKSLYFQTGDQMKFGKLSIRFHGEEGVDAGGVTREWFQVLSRQMFDPGYALFIPVSSDRTTFHPNQLSSINEEHLMFFKFIGRIIGKALYEGRVLDCHFSRAVYKRILGKAVSVKDMESLDPDYYKSLVWMLENDITDIITETFSVDNDKFGVVETIDFVENGRDIPVTEENKHEYVRLMVEWKLTGSVKEQLDEFLKGFHDIIPADLIAIFNEQELELLISGLPEIDVDDWKSHTEYHNYSASSPQIQWFWRAVRSYDKEERAKLLQFVTGTSKVPLNGFRELEGMNGFSRFNIHRDYGNKERLPSSHTCFNQLDLPEYESYETLRKQVLTAITAGSEYFGFA